MSNQLFQNPVKIDTAFSTPTFKGTLQTSADAGKNSQFTIQVVKSFWYNPVNIGDTFVIEDPVSSLILWQGKCEVADQAQLFDWSPRPRIFRDFIVPTLASGTLIIELV